MKVATHAITAMVLCALLVRSRIDNQQGKVAAVHTMASEMEVIPFIYDWKLIDVQVG